jgi:predicted porin
MIKYYLFLIFINKGFFMKKLLLGMLLVPAVTAQAADVTPYILINKEYRSTSQEKTANMKSSTGFTDVDGFETRFGAKGSQELENGMTAKGKVELGINSHRDAGNAERIRIRLAQMDLSGTFGNVTLGKHWNPNTLKMLSLDPFTGTGAQLLGLESGEVKGATGGNFGMRARYFNNGLTYTTPKFSGIQASVTLDENAHSSDPTDTSYTSGAKWTTAVLGYEKAIGESMLNLHITHAMGNIENAANQTLDNNESFTTLAAKFSNKMYGVSAAYTKDNKGEDTDGNGAKYDEERSHMLVAAWYNMNKFTFGLNYGKSTWDDKSTFTGTASAANSKGGSQSQIGAGVIYKLAKNIKTRLLYRNQKIENKGTATVAGTSTSNKANTFIAGATMSF